MWQEAKERRKREAKEARAAAKAAAKAEAEAQPEELEIDEATLAAGPPPRFSAPDSCPCPVAAQYRRRLPCVRACVGATLARVRMDRAPHTRGNPAKRRSGNWIMGGLRPRE